MIDIPLVYAGIGATETNDDHCHVMTSIATHLDSQKWTLRSGHADGADKAFEKGATRKEIFTIKAYPGCINFSKLPLEIQDRAALLASQHHPNWPAVEKKSFSKLLLSRDVCQVLGSTLDQPVTMVICWAPNIQYDDKGWVRNVKGGTGLAVRLAHNLGIPVIHLDVPAHAPLVSLLQGYPDPQGRTLLQAMQDVFGGAWQPDHVRDRLAQLLPSPLRDNPPPPSRPSHVAEAPASWSPKGRWRRQPNPPK